MGYWYNKSTYYPTCMYCGTRGGSQSWETLEWVCSGCKRTVEYCEAAYFKEGMSRETKKEIVRLSGLFQGRVRYFNQKHFPFDGPLKIRSIQEKYTRYYAEPNDARFKVYAHADEKERERVLKELGRLGVESWQIEERAVCPARCEECFPIQAIMDRVEAVFTDPESLSGPFEYARSVA